MQREELNNHRNRKESRLRKFLKEIYERLINIRGEPREIALGFALGIFIGMSPTMGIQIVIAVFFASILKWNKISAAIGVLITNPLTAPIAYSITYFVGAKILGLKKTDILPDDLGGASIFQLLSKTHEIIWAMFIGGAVIGLPLAILAYYLSYSAVRKYQDDIKSKIAEKKEKLIMKREEKKKRKREKRISG